MGVTAFLVIVASGIFVLAVYNINSVMDTVNKVISAVMPIFYGMAMAYILAPICTFFEKKCFRKIFFRRADKRAEKIRAINPNAEIPDATVPIKRRCRLLSVITTMLLTLLVLTGLAFMVIPQLVETVQTLVNNLPSYLDQINEWVSDFFINNPEVEEQVQIFTSNLTQTLQNFLTNSLLPQMTDIMSFLSTTVMDTIGVFMNLLMGFAISIYLLYNKELFAAQGKKTLYSLFKKTTSNRILRNLRHVHKAFGSFITSKLTDCLVIGLLVFITMTICSLPYAMLVSVIMCVANIIPYFGCFVGGIPCLLLMLVVDPIDALILLIIIFAVQLIDGNVISPLIIGENTGLSGFWVVFAMLVGQLLFGFIGLIVGIPLFAVLYSVFRLKISKRLENRELPTDTNVYRKIAYIDAETSEIITLLEVRECEEEERCEQERKLEEERRRNKKHRTLIKKILDDMEDSKKKKAEEEANGKKQ